MLQGAVMIYNGVGKVVKFRSMSLGLVRTPSFIER